MPTSNSKHGLIAGLTAIIIAVAIVGGAYWYMSGGATAPADTDDPDQPEIMANPNPAQPVVSGDIKIGIDPYVLMDMNGKTITEKSFPDKYKLVFFGFTHCTDECPIALQTMTRAISNMGADATKIQPLFISVDAKRDTPKVMKDYLKNFSPAILGATGTTTQLKAVENSFKVYASDGKVEVEDGDEEAVVPSHSGKGADHSGNVPDHSGNVPDHSGNVPDHSAHDEHHHMDDGGGDADVVNHSDNIYLLGPGNRFVNVFNGDVDAGTLTAALKSAIAPAP